MNPVAAMEYPTSSTCFWLNPLALKFHRHTLKTFLNRVSRMMFMAKKATIILVEKFLK